MRHLKWPGSLTGMSQHPTDIDRGDHVVGAELTVNAPAADIYALVSNPHRHHEIDGSGTVRSRAVGPEELAEGSRFGVNMRKFGLPYRLRLTVTDAVRPDTGKLGSAEEESASDARAAIGVVEWRQPTGHRWRWEMQPVSENTTTVREFYDATGQNRLLRAILGRIGVVQENLESIRASLARVQQHFASRE